MIYDDVTSPKELREKVIEVENRIKSLIDSSNGDISNKLCSWTEDNWELLKSLLNARRRCLNELFRATDSEKNRLKALNSLLTDLTGKMNAKGAKIYRNIISCPIDDEFDDDIMIEGDLMFCYNASESITAVEDDGYYGSDFDYMIDLIDSWCYHYPYTYHYIEGFTKSYNINDKPEMTDRDLQIFDEWSGDYSYDDGLLRSRNLNDIILCPAMHDLWDHKPYSIIDVLHLNDFWCEVKVVYQHLVDGRGNRNPHSLIYK